jgi:ribosomal RNA-processing protein 9
MGYVETLFGHQDRIMSIDALRSETCVSVGAQDKTARYWKIVDETQLVFRGGGRSRIREVLEGGLRADDEGEVLDENDAKDGPLKNTASAHKESMNNFIEGSLECIAMVDESTFVSGGDSGCVDVPTECSTNVLILLQVYLLMDNPEEKTHLYTAVSSRSR